MSKYKGLFTFDVENHRYLPVEQADGLIAEMDYHPEPEPKEPLIKDEKIRKIIRLWAEVNKSNKLFIGSDWNAIDEEDYMIEFADDNVFDFPAGHYTIAELCGEEE